jgi:hypothetical protein
MPCHAMHPIQDLFLEVFHMYYNLICNFYMQSYVDKNFHSCKKWVLHEGHDSSEEEDNDESSQEDPMAGSFLRARSSDEDDDGDGGGDLDDGVNGDDGSTSDDSAGDNGSDGGNGDDDSDVNAAQPGAAPGPPRRPWF